jgi:hypothetical protein
MQPIRPLLVGMAVANERVVPCWLVAFRWHGRILTKGRGV